MRTGQVAEQFGITTQALRDWIKDYGEYLSDSAKAVNSRFAEIKEGDFLVLATVHNLVHKEKMAHKDAKVRIASGYRIDDIEAYQIEPDFVPVPAVEQLIDATDIRINLEQVTKERDMLRELLDREHTEKRELQEEIRQLNDEIKKLHREIGRLEGKLDRDD